MVPITDLHYCKNCGCELSICIYVIDGEFYCCEDCYQHLPCHCADLMEQEEDRLSKLPSSIYVG
jgi:hypothetical protein